MGFASLPPLYSTRVAWSLGDVGTLPLAHTVLRRGRAACGPLASYRAAELQHRGEDARAVVVPSPSGVDGRWHAVVRRGNGTIEDPSKILRRKQVLGFLGGLKRALTAAATGGQSEMEVQGIGPSAGARASGAGEYSQSIHRAFGRLPGGGEHGEKTADISPSARTPAGARAPGVSAARLRLPISPGSQATIEVPLAIVGGDGVGRLLRLTGHFPSVLGAAVRVTRGPLRSLVAPRTRLALAGAYAAKCIGRPRGVAALLARRGYPDIARQVLGVCR